MHSDTYARHTGRQKQRGHHKPALTITQEQLFLAPEVIGNVWQLSQLIPRALT